MATREYKEVECMHVHFKNQGCTHAQKYIQTLSKKVHFGTCIFLWLSNFKTRVRELFSFVIMFEKLEISPKKTF